MADFDQPAAAPPAPKRARPKFLIVACVLLIVLGAGGGVAYWMMPQSTTAAHAQAQPHTNDGIISFEPFVANLADAGSARYLRINVRLIVDGVDDAERIQKSEVLLMRLRSGVLELLGEQTADEIVTPKGKTALKQAIAARAAATVQPTKVSDVLFSDFVVQF